MADLDSGAAAMTVVAQALTAYHSLCPDISAIRRGGDVETARDTRAGEVMASASVIVVAAVASSLSGSATPLVVAGILVAAHVSLYEWALRLPAENAA